MSLAQNVTLQDYLDYAQQRNGDRVGLENLDDNFESVKAALLNLSANPDWNHYVEETRVTSVQPETQGGIDVPADGALTITDSNNSTQFVTAGIDNTYVLVVEGDDTEYPVVSVQGEFDLSIKYPYVLKDGFTPGAPVNYKLIKREYVLPDDFRQLLAIQPTSASLPPIFPLSPAAIKAKAQITDVGGQPDWYSIYSRSSDSDKVIRFLPYPEGSQNISYDLTYQRWPEELVQAQPSDNVDWPPEFKNVLEKAIELEIARKNRDPAALQSAAQELAKVLPRAEAGATEDVNFRLGMIGFDENPNALNIRLDTTNA